MICYSYRCARCRYEMDQYAIMGQAPQWVACPICFVRMRPLSRMGRLFATLGLRRVPEPPRPPKGQNIVDRIRRMM